MATNLYMTALANGRAARYGDFVIVIMQAAAFATTAIEFQQVSTWARGRSSSGRPHNDRTAFIDRFETVLARSGSGIATKGSKPVLVRIVDGMIQNGMQMNEWTVPSGLRDSVEIKRKSKTGAAAVDAAPPAMPPEAAP